MSVEGATPYGPRLVRLYFGIESRCSGYRVAGTHIIVRPDSLGRRGKRWMLVSSHVLTVDWLRKHELRFETVSFPTRQAALRAYAAAAAVEAPPRREEPRLQKISSGHYLLNNISIVREPGADHWWIKHPARGTIPARTLAVAVAVLQSLWRTVGALNGGVSRANGSKPAGP